MPPAWKTFAHALCNQKTISEAEKPVPFGLMHLRRDTLHSFLDVVVSVQILPADLPRLSYYGDGRLEGHSHGQDSVSLQVLMLPPLPPVYHNHHLSRVRCNSMLQG